MSTASKCIMYVSKTHFRLCSNKNSCPGCGAADPLGVPVGTGLWRHRAFSKARDININSLDALSSKFRYRWNRTRQDREYNSTTPTCIDVLLGGWLPAPRSIATPRSRFVNLTQSKISGIYKGHPTCPNAGALVTR